MQWLINLEITDFVQSLKSSNVKLDQYFNGKLLFSSVVRELLLTLKVAIHSESTIVSS